MLARKIILGFGVATLVPMLIHYGIDVFIQPMNWRQYQKENAREFRELSQLREQERRASTDVERAKLRKQVELLQERQEAQREVTDAHRDQVARIRFFIGVPLGIVTTLFGSFVGAQAIGGGLMLGGIFTFSEGCYWYWADMPRVGRFLVLLVAFGVLLWIGYQRFSEPKQPANSS